MSTILFTATNTRILRLVIRKGPLTATEICNRLGIPPSLVRHGLWELRRSGYIDVTENPSDVMRRRYRTDRVRVQRELQERMLEFLASRS